jgi:osmoprotectant transport system substrate-binding protein
MMGKMPGCRKISGAVCFALAVLCGACTSAGNRGPPAQAQAAARPGTAIAVGSFDFPESVLLAYVYADALAAKGFPVRVVPDLGTRELVDPALMNGLIQIVPEYSGSALDFLSLGSQSVSSNAAATYRSLARLAERRGLVAAKPAPAQDGNAIVVTAATAARHHLRSIADLGGLAQHMVFGGPPECPERAYCLPGLERTYGLRFKAFTPTDAGGPLTLQALSSGQIGVGLLFTTDPGIPARHLVILADNGGLQPAENITPLIRRDTVTRYGPRLLAALDAVSARLSTAALLHLDARVELHRQDPRRVADSWLRVQELIPERQGVR